MDLEVTKYPLVDRNIVKNPFLKQEVLKHTIVDLELKVNIK